LNEQGSAYLFPGQGSQHVGMGRTLAQAFPAAREVYAQADDILGIDLTTICFDGPAEVLNDTFNAQAALLTTGIAALRALQEHWGSKLLPTYVAGHSLGEFTALVAAEALSFEDGVQLVRERGRLMKQAGDLHPGGMAAILGLDMSDVEQFCRDAQESSGEYVGIANDNCPGQIVVSGSVAALEKIVSLAEGAGAKRVVTLAVSIASHSPFMASAAEEFEDVLESVTMQPPLVPVIANVGARPLTDPQEIRQALVHQLTSPVRWTESIRWMIEHGARHFVEVGPKQVLTSLLKRIDRSVSRFSTDQALQTTAPC